MIYKCEIRPTHKCESLEELTTSASRRMSLCIPRTHRKLELNPFLVSPVPSCLGEITVRGLIKYRWKPKKNDKTHQSLVQKKPRNGKRDDGKCNLSSIERLAFMLFPRNCFGDPGVVDGVSSDTHGDAAHYEKLYSLYKSTLKNK